MNLSLTDLKAAQQRIAAEAIRTPLIKLPLENSDVYAKAENLQRTNSFKFRGAYNFLAAMPEQERQKGVTAPSSGNHAQGLACAAHLFGVPAAIAIPNGAPETKVKRTLAWGAEVVRCGPSAKERYDATLAFQEKGYTFVPPFDHKYIIAGQGTAGLEIAEDMPDLANVLVCTGGGGLLAGIALAISELCPNAQIIGVEPELAADASESFKTKELVTWTADQTNRTLADGVRTQHLGKLNFEIIKERVHGFVTVSEDALKDATRWYLNEAKLIVEPTGALTLAALHKLERGEAELNLKPGKTVVLISGGNIDADMLRSFLT